MPDVRWHNSGFDATAGDLDGVPAVLDYLMGTNHVEDYDSSVIDMLASDERVAVIARTSGRIGTQEIANDFVQVIRIADGRIARGLELQLGPARARRGHARGGLTASDPLSTTEASRGRTGIACHVRHRGEFFDRSAPHNAGPRLRAAGSRCVPGAVDGHPRDRWTCGR